jgi:hypothetical protein
MSDETRYHTAERSPPLRVRTRTWADSPNLFVLVEECRGGEWCRVGSIDLGHGPIDRRGVAVDDVIDEWAFMRFHASGDRVKVSRRLRLRHSDRRELTLEVEEKRRQVLGPDGRREEHDWLQQRATVLTAPAVAGGWR